MAMGKTDFNINVIKKAYSLNYYALYFTRDEENADDLGQADSKRRSLPDQRRSVYLLLSSILKYSKQFHALFCHFFTSMLLLVRYTVSVTFLRSRL